MAENLFTPGCIRTSMGLYINPSSPDPALININDIAHALSMQPRFGGHLPVFYSVAQHCVLASLRVPVDHQLSALMHDASEAYLMDIPRPVKQQLSNYKDIENSLMRVIADIFGIQWPVHAVVKDADEFMLNWEWHSLMLDDKSMPPIVPWDHDQAKGRFMDRFYSLVNVREVGNG